MKSSFLNIDWRELSESLILLFITTLIAGLAETVNAGRLPTWPEVVLVLKAGLIACLSYIFKNLLRNNEGKYFKRDVPVIQLKRQIDEKFEIALKTQN